MGNFIPGSIIGFREGLEAFLMIVISIKYLDKINKKKLKKYVKMGVGVGIAISLAIGGILYLISNAIADTERLAKVWESISSLIALALVTTFILWMIRHGADMAKEVESKTGANLSKGGLIFISALMVAREGVEIAVFTFAGKYELVSIAAGLLLSVALTLLVFYSLVKVSIKAIFNITIVYMILQAGFLIGTGIHEGLEALAGAGVIGGGSMLLTPAYDFTNTVFDHHNGIIGLPLYVLAGWNSDPEWLRFAVQYIYTGILLFVWVMSRRAQKQPL